MVKKIISSLFFLVFIFSLFACVAPRRFYEPPPQKRVYVPKPPSATHVWVKGHWAWRGGRWVWINGYYMRGKPGYRWAPGHYEWRGYYKVWIRGRWVRVY